MSPYLTDRDVADRFGISVPKVHRLCANGWPHMRVGRDYRFTAAHIAAIEQLCERTATPETPADTWGVKTR